MTDLPKDDLLQFAQKWLIALMFESGMNSDTIEGYIARLPYTSPLRKEFALQYIVALQPEDREAAVKRLLDVPLTPVVGMSVRTKRYTVALPVSMFMNKKDVDKIAQRVFQSDNGSSPNLSKDN